MRANILHTEIIIKIGNILSQRVSIVSGLRQKDALSPVLYNIALEKVIRESHCKYNGIQLGSCTIGILAYTDNLLLLAERKENLIEQDKKFFRYSKKNRFRNKC
jgi:hypothetical protein